MSEAIKVVVRVRPMNSKENERGCKSVFNVEESGQAISIRNPNEVDNVKHFTFDNVFDSNSTQELIYSKTAYSLVENVLLGYNGTIFAYGQTGCGKTHSMVGVIDSPELQGIIPRSFGQILKAISETKDKEFLIRCSFIEIYNEEVKDLLGKDIKAKLEVKESPDKGVFIKDLSMNAAKTHQELMDYMNIGNKNRSVGETAMNKESSRSHLLFMLYLESCNITENEDSRKYIASKLNLVDLAGSERLSKTGAEGDRLKEAQKINLSLSALGNVISALVDGKSSHIPYRDSKLTRLLQDSLGGNTKTVMIANCSPADYNFDESLSTLRYASRAKFIKNKPIINEDPKDTLLKEYADEIRKLKQMLSQQGGGTLPLSDSNTSNSPNDEIEAQLKEKEEQLDFEKERNEQLLERIKALEKQHLEAKDVRIDPNIVISMEKAEAMLSQKIIEKQKEEESIEEEEIKIDQGKTGEIKTCYKELVKKLKGKIKQLETEVKDIEHEHYIDKESLNDDVRMLTKENKLLEGILAMLLQQTEIEAIKLAADYNAEKDEYKIPPFYLKQKQIFFPKIENHQALDLIKEEKEKREVVWGEKDDSASLKQNQNAVNNAVNSSRPERKQEYSVKDLIREARNEKILHAPVLKEEKKANLRKLHLEPLRRE